MTVAAAIREHHAAHAGFGVGFGDRASCQQYAEFADQTRWYTNLAEGLLRVVPEEVLRRAGSAVDLGSGTGVMTAALLRRLPSSASVVGLEQSREMVEAASERIDDPRVQWLVTRCEDAPRELHGSADLVACSAGPPTLPVDVILITAAELLRPAGLLALNVPPAVVGRAPGHPGAADGPDLTTILAREHKGRRPLTLPLASPADLVRATRARGFQDVIVHAARFVMSARDQHRWLSIPMFLPELPGLDVAARHAALDAALATLGPDTRVSRWWHLLTARRSSDHTPADTTPSERP